MIGRIFDIQRFSVHDGPGIRTTVFMKGCPLSCEWCHNPEGLSYNLQLKYNKKECIICKSCGMQNSLSDAEKCPTGALQVCGRDMDENQVLAEVLKDKSFYTDKGGVTFSGGECLMQADFVSAVLKLCKENKLNTAIDTSGFVSFDSIEKTIDNCDLYLYDIKAITHSIHTKYTGVSNKLILENLVKLTRFTDKIELRVPIIPGFNDDEIEMTKIAEFIRGLNRKLCVTLIPYHGLGVGKYQTIGLEQKYVTDKRITKERLTEIAKMFTKFEIKVN